jgi:hypothetical protein
VPSRPVNAGGEGLNLQLTLACPLPQEIFLRLNVSNFAHFIKICSLSPVPIASRY